MIKTISIWDFDSTLVASPEPTQENKDLWSKTHNRPWPHKGMGWWSKSESLCIDAFNPQCISHVKDAAIKAIEDPTVYTALVTGRIPMFSKTVKEILRLNGVPYFDAYHFNNSHRTLEFKVQVFETLKKEFPNATHFEIWEDRMEHIPHFEQWGIRNYGKNFTMNIVK